MRRPFRLSLALGLTLGTMAILVVAADSAAAASAASASYTETQVSNGGTVRGRVYFESDFPPPQTTQPDRDADTCGVRVPSEEFVVDADSKGLAHVVVRIEGISSGKAFADAEHAIEQLKCRYSPHVSVVRPGEEFNIINQDPILHNVHAYLGDETAFNLAQPFQGQASPQTLEQEGIVRVACDVHKWMEAWVLVIESPYFAITDSSGNFSISDVPPGSYTISMWHEILGSGEKTVTVTGDSTSTVDFVIGG
ncbi:MAG: carboxypeptidase regulatory-like domain-containing protein [Thermoanaerobaculia bacterium]